MAMVRTFLMAIVRTVIYGCGKTVIWGHGKYSYLGSWLEKLSMLLNA